MRSQATKSLKTQQGAGMKTKWFKQVLSLVLSAMAVCGFLTGCASSGGNRGPASDDSHVDRHERRMDVIGRAMDRR